MNLANQLQRLILGALLHDMGKVLQRSGTYGVRDHSTIGLEYVQGLKISDDDKKAITDCIKLHHRANLEQSDVPANSLAYAVYEADNVAAGVDRRKREEVEVKSGQPFNSSMVLHSVFPKLKGAKLKENNSREWGYLLRTLAPGQPINYPVDLKEREIRSTKAAYFEASDTLKHNLDNMDPQQPNSILQVLEATASLIPSSTKKDEVPDVSLYDHLKLTTAIASCIYLYFREEKKSDNFKSLLEDNQRNELYYRLVSADISGIQNFIYTVSSKKALKALRARSFYLDLMLEHIADEILGGLGLSRANLLYTGGGHFYMLLPNTKTTKELLKKVSEKVNWWMLEHYGLNLFIAITAKQCSSADLMDNEKTGKIFKTLTRQLSKIKLQRYNFEQLQQMFDPDSNLYQYVESERECKSCRSSSKKMIKETEIENEKLEDLCSNCSTLVKIGEKLVKHTKAGEHELCVLSDTEYYGDLYLEIPSLSDDKKYLSFLEREEVEKLLKDPGSSEQKRVYSINKWLQGISFSTKLWVGDYVAENPDRSKTGHTIDFEQLQDASKGIKRLAVLRADVDSLGKTFTSGFRGKLSTISRYATLSRQLTLFFKHYINSICQQKYKSVSNDNNKSILTLHKEDGSQRMIAIVYSGGDDLFAVGAWNEIIQFALDLREAFGKFTSYTLSFSAGVGFFNHSFPITQMAELTGKLEELAKNYPNKDSPQKDAIALFGLEPTIKGKTDDPRAQHVYNWQEFNEHVLGKMKTFTETFSFDKKEPGKIQISTASLYRILNLTRLINAEDEERNAENRAKCINLARFAYAVSRMEPRGEDKEILQLFNKFKDKLFEWVKDPPERKSLLTAINLLIYLYRENENEERGD